MSAPTKSGSWLILTASNDSVNLAPNFKLALDTAGGVSLIGFSEIVDINGDPTGWCTLMMAGGWNVEGTFDELSTLLVGV